MKQYYGVKLILTFYSITLAGSLVPNPKKAVFKIPVADVFFEQLSVIYDYKLAIDQLYNSSPLFSTSPWGCRRAIQCLYNEVVEVVKEIDEEVCIVVPHLFYNVMDRASKNSTFWTLKTHLFTFDDLQLQDIDCSIFPEPISYKHPETVHNPNVLVLCMPWYDAVTEKTYSAGTRFVRKPERDTGQSFAVRLLDMQDLQEKEGHVPKNVAFVFEELSKQERQKRFVDLLQRWVDRSNGVLPYVWGGSSITQFLSDDEFDHMHANFIGRVVAFWTHRESKPPHSGIDCSLLILRAAQICGIPYFFKNSYTLAHYLRPLQRGEDIEAGDIIWYDGHVIVVSDIKNNNIIESCGHPFGFGKAHSIAIGKRLAQIYVYDDLLREYFDREFIGSLDKEGVVRRILETFKILKFSSIWDC